VDLGLDVAQDVDESVNKAAGRGVLFPAGRSVVHPSDPEESRWRSRTALYLLTPIHVLTPPTNPVPVIN